MKVKDYGETNILVGLRRVLSVTCFFVVRTSQTGESSTSSSTTDEEVRDVVAVGAKRSCLPDKSAFSLDTDLMCARRAVDAFWTCAGSSSYRDPVAGRVVSAVGDGDILFQCVWKIYSFSGVFINWEGLQLLVIDKR